MQDPLFNGHPALQICRRISSGEAKLPELPEVSLKIRRLLNQPDWSMRELQPLIESDPALASYLLKISESPLYGNRGRAPSLKQIITQTGERALNQLVTAFALRHLFISTNPHIQQALKRRWQHAIQRAAIACVLGQQCYGFINDELLLAALLEDIGSLLIIRETAHIPNLGAAELESLCNNHSAEVGVMLTIHWEMPESLRNVVRQRQHWSYDPEGAIGLPGLVIVASRLLASAHGEAFALPNLHLLPAFQKLPWRSPQPKRAEDWLEQHLEQVNALLSSLQGPALPPLLHERESVL
ncbi:HDOD domain-containing protein [Atopomonas sediminilitoris]|uniref:HDOD domain-containing protein n=1 Tax=Atopomonas sediminilitoris TaxID=2919919 RepID=UPI001F4D41B7|nr:HDOD domain-containing protein [Atopomonas sediminilitoris]MCJ8168607.1 HDOD domain-containing protein [Atopomonas sediminilitoris]